MTHNEIYYKALKSFPYGDLSSIMQAIRIAIEDECEACAKICDEMAQNSQDPLMAVAAAQLGQRIHARSSNKK